MSWRSARILFALLVAVVFAPAAQAQPVHIDNETIVDIDSPSDRALPDDEAAEAVDESLIAEIDDEAEENNNPCNDKKCAALKKQQAGAYKPLFYANDFSYLCDPCYCECRLDCYHGECLKRLCVHDCAVLDIGGQYRIRYHSEHNHRGLGLTGNSDDFLLHRTRLFANYEHRCFRAYVEYIDAVSNYENDNPRPIEENRSDLLNAFGEVLLWDNCCSEFRARVGRQELLYGQQRIVSPLDWANTRRTFHGYKGMVQTASGWKIDGFYMNTLDPDTRNFDSINDDETFMGLYAANTDCCGTTRELFYLRLDDQKNQGPIVQNFDYHTIGGRIQGAAGDLLYEAWGGYQFGDNTDGTAHSAGAFTVGLGRAWECHCWKPTLWVYYDWASSDGLGAGDGNGYHHLFPLGHKYLGFMDLYGRRNIRSPNARLTLQPHDKLTLLVWYYYFGLENINDAPYSVVMTPYNAGNAPGDRELGHEIDLIATYKICPRKSVLFGYSHFFAGDYYQTTTLPAGADGADADFFYTQFHVNF